MTMEATASRGYPDPLKKKVKTPDYHKGSSHHKKHEQEPLWYLTARGIPTL
jgi:hypothetical protein